MRIVDVEVIELRVPLENELLWDGSYATTLVRVHTNSGITGVGEVESAPSVIRAIIEAPYTHAGVVGLRRVILGEDPLDTRRLWEKMYEETFYYGRRGVVIHALAGIDIALWDIRGQAEGRPIADLLGPRRRDRVKAYGTIYPTGATQDEIRRNIDRGLARGVRAIKVCGDPAWRGHPEKAAFVLRTAREHVGPAIDLMLDASLAWETAEQVEPVLAVLAECRYEWLEAPLPLDDLAGHARLAGRGVPIAGGDLGLTTRFEFMAMMDEGRVDIVQPDVSMCGGLSEVLRIADAAAERGARVVLHGYKGDLHIAANLAFYAASPSFAGPLEYSMSESPLRWDLTHEHFAIDRDGMVPVVTGAPGLGVTLNEQTLDRYRVG
jgi:L-alanine-DL-glutamate epimerase-like enolase superfamily enzyme